MKTFLFSITALVFLISCSSKKTITGENQEKTDIQEVNYIPYYLEVYKVDSLMLVKKDEEAFQKLDSLFRIYQPKNQVASSEILNYVLLAEKLKKNIDTKKYIQSLIKDWGIPVKELKKETALTQTLQNIFSDTELLSLEQQHIKNIDWEYRKILKEMFVADQKSRSKQDEPQVDEDNIKKMLHLIKTKGYPDIPTVGRIDLERIMLSVMYLHFARADEYKEFRALLFENLKKGKATPIEMKQFMLGKYNLVYQQNYFEQTTRDTIRLRGITTNYPKDTFNIRRRNIGLPSLEYEKWKNNFMKQHNN
ncbi:hypothetical protein ACM46_21690 [Chryseobacterium angstadtii]|uniref:Lipoprotein n=1 Tax=Chryseobacterium angstadtii TaxID=558151 RepID=A0A0J7KMU8_9FLAO|nr:hypothetical protein [Chryseobacterium angstadtii]KMQ58635.1 hypothetical protein ACM46_21690 [Chryseobacterium angstadtii]